jgi:hypothetical protein
MFSHRSHEGLAKSNTIGAIYNTKTHPSCLNDPEDSTMWVLHVFPQIATGKLVGLGFYTVSGEMKDLLQKENVSIVITYDGWII